MHGGLLPRAHASPKTANNDGKADGKAKEIEYFHCHQKGHKKKDCPHKDKKIRVIIEEEKPDEENVKRITAEPTELFEDAFWRAAVSEICRVENAKTEAIFTLCLINGHRVYVLVDSGASVSCIPLSCARSLPVTSLSSDL